MLLDYSFQLFYFALKLLTSRFCAFLAVFNTRYDILEMCWKFGKFFRKSWSIGRRARLGLHAIIKTLTSRSIKPILKLLIFISQLLNLRVYIQHISPFLKFLKWILFTQIKKGLLRLKSICSILLTPISELIQISNRSWLHQWILNLPYQLLSKT